MPSPLTKFRLITAGAAILAAVTGFILKLQGSSMSQLQQFGWGFVFVASCLTTVRGFRYLMKMK